MQSGRNPIQLSNLGGLWTGTGSRRMSSRHTCAIYRRTTVVLEKTWLDWPLSLGMMTCHSWILVPLSSHTESPFANRLQLHSLKASILPSSFHFRLASSQLPPRQRPIQRPLSSLHLQHNTPAHPFLAAQAKACKPYYQSNTNLFASSSLSHLALPPATSHPSWIYPYLTKHLNSLEPDVCTIEINKMLRLSIYECDRENNIHLNKELLASKISAIVYTSWTAGSGEETGAKEAEERQKRGRRDVQIGMRTSSLITPLLTLTQKPPWAGQPPVFVSPSELFQPPLCPLAEPSSSLTTGPLKLSQ